jgi:MSHA biogenesis protein MshO
MATSRISARHAGFTLVEAIVAITILGVLGAMVAVFIKSPIEAYFNQASRAVLTDAADGALRRISRDIGAALPNSLRSTSLGSPACFELLPVVAAGRYRYQQGCTANCATASPTLVGDILDFTATDASFDVLGQVKLDNLPGANLVAIYNLGIPGADAYAADNTAAISSASATSITLSGTGKKFPFQAPGKAFSVIPNYSVVYSCAGTSPSMTLYRTTQSISSTPMTACPSSGTALVTNVSSCSFTYTPAVNQREGILSISLELTLNSETVRLYNQVMVSNAP